MLRPYLRRSLIFLTPLACACGSSDAPSDGHPGDAALAVADTGSPSATGVDDSGSAATGTTADGGANTGFPGVPEANTSDVASAPPSPADASKPDSSAPGATDPGTTGDGDYMIGPTYMNAPELMARTGVPMGKMTTLTMSSADSKAYPGLNGPYMRNVNIYVPSQYVAGTPAPFIVVQDGSLWLPRLTSILLDNMIHDHRVPALIAILVDNGGGDSKGSERGLEYDTVSDRYVNFVESEVLPRVEMAANVMLTRDPSGRAALGGSSGGAAAFTMGWFRPDLYQRILTYSGTYVNQESPTDPMYPHGAWEYPEHLVAGADPPKPLRVWLEVGTKDNGAGSSAAGMHNWVLANQMMAMALAVKHYHYRFELAQGGTHVDNRVVWQTLPEALEWLWRGYPF